MITKDVIDGVISDYDLNRLSIATICSHSALQIFHGARQLKFKTIGITTIDRRVIYEAFPLAQPDEFIEVQSFKDVLDESVQGKLRDENAIIVLHGSFVEYVGAEGILRQLLVPTFGNRLTLLWEGDRARQRLWLEKAGLKLPKEFKGLSDVNEGCKVFVKFPGAKGGRGYFTAKGGHDLSVKLEEAVKKGLIESFDQAVIQEFVSGVRYYFHCFYSPFAQGGLRVGSGRLELLSMDKRIEVIDEAYRGLPDVPLEFFDYTVTGNMPVVIREAFLKEALAMGAKVVEASRSLFPPGLIGPFCVEAIYHPERGFIVFEVSARIVAGTNLYPTGSPYTPYLFHDWQMSTGKRIALEVKVGLETGRLKELLY